MAITAAQGTRLRAQIAQMDRHQDLAGRHLGRAISSLKAERRIAAALEDPYSVEEIDETLASLNQASTKLSDLRR